MSKVAWLGLGQMGAPMAARVLDAGHEVTVWNRSEDKGGELVEKGARRASSPADAMSQSEIAITMLASPAALDEVLFGEAEAARALEGKTLVEMSTVGPDCILETAAKLPESTELLDAPVLGSVAQATDGSLKILVGGSRESFDGHRALLEALGTPTYFGPQGAGAAMKLVANSTLGALTTALGEALGLADALGLDQGTVMDALAESPIGPALTRKRGLIESERYPPSFKLELAVKDLGLVLDIPRF